MIEAGFAKVDFTPSGQFPLAGYTHLRERLATRVRDPLEVRALAVRDGGKTIVLLAFDLLLVTPELAQALSQRLKDTGAALIVHATHTPSSLGGLSGSLLARLFMGRPRDWVIPHLVQAGERAARTALEDLAEAEPRAACAILPGLNGNRRDPSGPKDEELSILRLCREKGDGILVSYPGHPVIVAERDHHAASADFPGEVCRLLERDFPFGMFIQGALGGVDVLYPNDPGMSADRNLSMMAVPIAISAINLARQAPACLRKDLAHARLDLSLSGPDCRLAFDEHGFLDLPLRPFMNALVRGLDRSVPMQAIRIGDFALVGTPADLGVGLALAIKETARAAGVKVPVAASETDGYIGYVHPREAYRKVPPRSYWAMAHYENAMNFFGRDTAKAVLDAAKGLVQAVK